MNPVIVPDLLRAGLTRGLTLAQGSFFQAPPALEKDGGAAALLFERPLALAGAMLVLGVVAFLTLNRREKGRLGALVLGAFVVAAIGAAAAGYLVETPRERVRARTAALVHATGRADAPAVATLLSDEVDLLMGGQRVPGGRGVILAALAAIEGQYAPMEARVVSLQARVDSPTRARTQVQVRAAPEGGAPSLSWWLLNWSTDATGEWRITRIDGLLINGQRPSASWIP